MSDINVKTELTRADFTSDQEPRWCAGCGDYSILAQMKKILPELGVPKENYVFVSGIGCSSRFPYYLDTYGFHGIHGRAPAIASGIKLANPDLKVFVITGDGDALSIGGNHFIHLCRRNIDITVILFNNQIYGLTKGQYSPTSERGKLTKSSPYGSIESPFNPVQMALAAGATFVARSVDRETKHLREILDRAARHKGTAFVEVYQNCNIFNDGAFMHLTGRKMKKNNLLVMQHGKPYIFGENEDKAITWSCEGIDVVEVDPSSDPDNLIKHNEQSDPNSSEFILSGMTLNPDLPTPIGVFREIKTDTYEDMLTQQIESIKLEKGDGDLNKLLNAGSTWEVQP